MFHTSILTQILQKENTKLYLSFLIMEVYYTKKEYNDMKRSLEKKIQLLEKRNAVLTSKVKQLKNKDVTD